MIKETIIIPAFEPSDNLVELINKIKRDNRYIIVVDDGSTNKKVFEKISDDVILISYLKNCGKGYAIKKGLQYILDNIKDTDIIGVMDADLQHLPKDIDKLFKVQRKCNNTIILGVRNVGKDMPFRSRIGNKITRLLFRLITGYYVSDTQTGLRTFNRSLIPFFLNIKGDRYEYESNILVSCVKQKVNIVEVKIETIYLDRKNSSSHFKPIRDSFLVYKNLLKFSLASFSSFIIDYFLFGVFYWLFTKFKYRVLVSNVLARIISANYNYLINCQYVFKSGKKNTYVKYFMLAIGILIGNNFILFLYSKIFRIMMAKILTELTLFIVSYVVQSLIIFKKEDRKK